MSIARGLWHLYRSGMLILLRFHDTNLVYQYVFGLQVAVEFGMKRVPSSCNST